MKIGLLVSRQGPAGLWAPTCDACTMLAAAELNAQGGVLDRAVEIVPADAGMSEAEATGAARTMIEVDEVDAVIGMHASNLRAPVALGLAGRVPYVYSPMYEGGEQTPEVLPIGGTDDELIGHAIPWLMEHRRATRFFVFGNDYLWPRWAAVATARIVSRCGGRLVGCSLVPFGTQDYGPAFAAIADASPDVVITMLLGEESVRFNRAFADAGLAGRMLRLGLASDETVLYGGGADAHENLFVPTTYVAAGAAPRADRFVELYREGFGAVAPPATVFGQSCYDAVHLLAGLSQTSRRPGRDAWRHRFSRLADSHPDRRALPTTLMAAAGRVYLAEARGLELKVVATR